VPRRSDNGLEGVTVPPTLHAGTVITVDPLSVETDDLLVFDVPRLSHLQLEVGQTCWMLNNGDKWLVLNHG
jgi:hypothetical protein